MNRNNQNSNNQNFDNQNYTNQNFDNSHKGIINMCKEYSHFII